MKPLITKHELSRFSDLFVKKRLAFILFLKRVASFVRIFELQYI